MKKPHELLLIYASILGLCTLMIVSCDPPGKMEDNRPPIEFDLPGAGTFIRYAVSDGSGGTHYIYVRKEKPMEQPISVTSRAGKHTVTTIIVDGVEYVPANPPPK